MDEQERNLLAEQYKTWLKSPVGVDLLRYLTELYDGSIDAGVDSTDFQKKALELQNASAYKTIRSYIERMSTE